jgi:hypothetical protein
MHEAPNLMGPTGRAILSSGTAQTINFLRYAPDDGSSPSVVTGKMSVEN